MTNINSGPSGGAKSLLFLIGVMCLCEMGSGFCGPTLPLAITSLRGTLTEAHAAPDGNDAKIRLNKVFKATHSRRQADDLVASGRVTINGEPADSAGRRVMPFRDIVRLDGKVVHGWEALNACVPTSNEETQHDDTTTFEYKYWKPCGVTCTTDRSIPDNILDCLEQESGYRPDHRVYPVGRLDKETSGLILLTSDGRLPNSALRGRHKQPKTYEVWVDYPFNEQDLKELREGIVITTQAQRDGKRAPPLTAKTKPCVVERIDKRGVRMTLVEGRNRQIRKMIAALGLRVVELHRCEFMRIRLDPLRGPGDWAALSPEELAMVSQVIAAAEEEENETLESW